MRIHVDRDLCQGHGMCEMEAPDLFEARRDTVNLRDPHPGETHRDDVERAVQYCPTQAITITDD